MSARRVLIVGAGPAGLAASAALADCGVDGLIFDGGPELQARSQRDPRTILSGPGGAGLFSDGKFSFFPSASRLWEVEPRERLETAWAWFSELLETQEVAVPDLPPLRADAGAGFDGVRKRYDSVYVSLDQRHQLIRQLLRIGLPLRTSAQVTALSLDRNGVELRAGQGGEHIREVADAIVLATGRFGPLYLGDALAAWQRRFERVEVGVRIEQAADEFFLRHENQLDPKIIYKDGDVEYRTFCCCRDGLVAATDFRGLKSVSGRADGPRTGRSNVGFNVRIRDEELALRVWGQASEWFRSGRDPVAQPLPSFMAGGTAAQQESQLAAALGPALSGLLRTGLDRLMQDYGPMALEGAVLIGPTVEGVGLYPAIGGDLRIPGTDVWVAGDLSGIFRGLTAAMVSGYLAGRAAAESIGTEWRHL